MALARATPLLTTAAEVVDLTSTTDLANLEVGAEFSVADTLLRAHEWVFDLVEQRLGASAPALITNQTRLERAVAARFMAVLFAAGAIHSNDSTDARDYWDSQARDEVNRYRAELSSGDEAANSSGGIPEVGHFEGGWAFPPMGGSTYDRTIPRASS